MLNQFVTKTKQYPEYFLELQKTVFFLSGQALAPSPPGPLKKTDIFCGFPNPIKKHPKFI